MYLVLIALSNIVVLSVIFFLRHMDRDNRSFEKIHKLGKSLENELTSVFNQKMNEIITLQNKIQNIEGQGQEYLNKLTDKTDGIKKIFNEYSKEKQIIHRLDDDYREMNEKINTHDKSLEEFEKTKIFSKNVKKVIRDALKEMKGIKEEVDSFNNALMTNKEVFLKEADKVRDEIEELRINSLDHVKQNFQIIQEEQVAKFTDIKSQFDNLNVDLIQKLEKQRDDYSKYIIKVEDRGEHFLEDFTKKLEREKENKQLDFNQHYTIKMKDLEKYHNDLQSQARNNINKELKSYNGKLKEIENSINNLNKNSEQRISEYEVFLEKSKDHMALVQKDSIDLLESKKNEIELQIETAKNLGEDLQLTIFDNIKQKLKAFESDQYDNLENLKSDFSSNIDNLSQFVEKQKQGIINDYNYVSDMSNKKKIEIDEFLTKVNTSLSDITDRQKIIETEAKNNAQALKNEIDYIIETVDKQKDEYKNRLMDNLTKMKDFANQNVIKLKDYFDKERNKNFENIQKAMLEVSDEANGKTSDLKERFEEKYKEIEKDLLSVENDMLTKSKEVQHNMLVKVQDLESEIETEKSNMSARLDDDIKQLQETIIGKEELLDVKLKDFENNYNKKISNIETRIIDEEQKIKDIENSHINIEKSLDYLKKTFTNDIESKILEGKEDIDSIFSEGKKFLTQEYTDLENETINKIESYRQNLDKIKSNLKLIYEKNENIFNKKMTSIDERFQTKMDMLNEKNRISINDLIERTDQLESDFKNKLENIESEYYKKGESLLLNNQEQLTLFEEKYSNLNQKIDKLNNNIDKELELKVDDVRIMLNKEYNELESNTIGKINSFHSEISAIKEELDDFHTQLEKVYERGVNEVDKKFSNKSEEINTKYNSDINKIEEDFLAKSDSLLKISNDRINSFSDNIDSIEKQINLIKQKLDTEVDKKINDGQEKIQEMHDTNIKNAKNHFDETENNLIAKLEDYQKEYLKLQKNMKQIDERFTAKFLEHSGALDKRIADIEVTIKQVEKKSIAFEKASEFQDKLKLQINDIKENMNEIKTYKISMNDLEKRMLDVSNNVSETQTKFDDIVQKSNKVDNLTQAIDDISYYIDDAEAKIERIREAKLKIDNMGNSIFEIEKKINTIEKQVNTVNSNDQQIKIAISQIDDVMKNAETLMNKYSLLDKKYDDLLFKEETFEKSFKSFEKEANIITQSEYQIREVVDKFNQMDHLIEDLETRIKEINNMREFLVKNQTRVDNLNQEAEKNIKLMQSLMKNNNEKPENNKIFEKENKKEAVMKLRNQGWAIDQIAKSLDLSISEVEFILELETNVRHS